MTTPLSQPAVQTESRERVLEGLFLGSPIPMLLVDARSKRIARANAAMGVLLECEAEDLTGQPLRHIDPTEGSEADEYLLLALACGDDRARRRSWRTQQGNEVSVEIRAARLHGDQGTLVALYVRDVKAEREAEEDRGRLQSQLWMAQKHEAVGRLAAGLAHDFNNLLSAIFLTTEGLKSEFPDDIERLTELDLILEAGKRARELTRELLAFSGRQVLESRPVSLNDIVTDMDTLLRRTLPQDIDLVVRPCDSNTTVHADAGQMEQVLLNLVVNAGDAMPDGGYLVVGTQAVNLDEEFARNHPPVKPGAYVELSVTDTGDGMDEETQARIFEPFFSTKGQGEGRGLGLATVYGIVKQSGGTIWVTSQPGIGSTFRVFLPRMEIRAEASRTHDEITGNAVPRGSEHILLVEDDDATREQAAKLLRRLGYQVTESATPEDALRIHEGLWPERGPHPVDLLLTDVVMPGMSGVELVHQLRIKREDLPVIYVSGYLDPTEEAGDTTEDASAEHLAKPFTLMELSQRVRAFLDA